MSNPSLNSVRKPGGDQLEYVDTKHEEANIGLPNLEPVRTVNEINSGFILTMIGFSLTFIVAEITPLFLITVFTIIAYDTNGFDYVIWIIVSQFIAIGAICPFVGSLSDAFGRKTIVLASLALTVLGQILLGTAHNISQAIAAQVIIGLAIGIQLLTVIAAVTELVPASQRGITIGYVVCGLIPFMPASLYGQYIAAHSWRYITALLGGMAVLSFVMLFLFYKPPKPENAEGLTTVQILKRMDYLGGFLSTAGVVIFLIGLNWGGQDYAWGSAHVVSTLTLGLALLVLFGLWEAFGTKYPMFPRRLCQNVRLFSVISFLCLTSGVNYIPVVVFWVVQCYTVYEATFLKAGIYLLPIGFCIIGGAIISAFLISVFPKRINFVLAFFCVVQTAGLGCLAAIDPENINTAWAPLCIGLVGVGGVLLPSQVVFSIITPNELIGTGVALSVVIRLVGQVIGVSMYYNIFKQHVTERANDLTIEGGIAFAAISAGFTDVAEITKLVTTLSAGPLSHYADIFPQLANSPEKIASIVAAGHVTYKGAYPILYLIAIAFGSSSVVASFFLWGLDQFMNDEAAVLL